MVVEATVRPEYDPATMAKAWVEEEFEEIEYPPPLIVTPFEAMVKQVPDIPEMLWDSVYVPVPYNVPQAEIVLGVTGHVPPGYAP